jgi:hypothetical protein
MGSAEEKRSAYRILVGKPEGRRPLRRPRLRWIAFKEMGLGGMDWIHLTQDKYQWRAVVITERNLQVPLNSGKFLSG